MKLLKLTIIAISSIILVSCSNYQSPKTPVSVRYEDNGTIRVTTYEDGSEKVENLRYLRFKDEHERD